MLSTHVKVLITGVEQLLSASYGHERVLGLLTKENQRLREENQRLVLQNAQLFDRLMARDFERYATYKSEDATETLNPFVSMGSKYEPDLDEQNIGEVVTDETIRGN